MKMFTCSSRKLHGVVKIPITIPKCLNLLIQITSVSEEFRTKTNPYRRKEQIFTFEKLEPSTVWDFFALKII